MFEKLHLYQTKTERGVMRKSLIGSKNLKGQAGIGGSVSITFLPRFE